MGYRKIKLSGDGDCFFHGIALFLRERDGSIPVLPNSRFAFTSWQVANIRSTIASAAVESLFPGGCNLKILNHLATNVTEAAHVDNFLDALPALSFDGVVSKVAFKRALPHWLKNAWPNANPGMRKKIAALFLLWYQHDSAASKSQLWHTKAQLFGYGPCNYCIHGDVDLNAEGSGQDSGFAAHLVYHVLGLNITPVLDSENVFNPLTLGYLKTLTARDPDHYYLVHSGIHFDAACWVDDALDPAISDQSHGLEISLKSAFSSRSFAAVSRAIKNTHRSSLVLGVGVWNINHLGEVSLPLPEPKEGSEKLPVLNETKNDLKVKAVKDILQQNSDWLDVFTLNEVNRTDGLDLLEKAGYEVHEGPHLISKTEGGGTEREGQNQYYPLVFTKNTKRDFTLEWSGCFYVNSKGKSTKSSDGQKVEWTKPDNIGALVQRKMNLSLATAEYVEGEDGNKFRKSQRQRKKKKIFDPSEEKNSDEPQIQIEEKKPAEPTRAEMIETSSFAEEYCLFRPVVVHQLIVDKGQEGAVQVNVAVVHTTPDGTEFERVKVYEQLNAFFMGVGKPEVDLPCVEKIPVYWIILGDFYLFAESRIVEDKARGEAAPDRVKALYDEEVELEKKLIGSLKKGAERLRGVSDLIDNIWNYIDGMKMLPSTRIARMGKIQVTDMTKAFNKLRKECEEGLKNYTWHPSWGGESPIRDNEKPSSEDLWQLAGDVDKLLKLRLPADEAEVWIAWWLSVVPKCYSEAAAEFREIAQRKDKRAQKAWQTYAGNFKSLQGAVQQLEQLEDAKDAALKKLAILHQHAADFAAIVECLNDLDDGSTKRKRGGNNESAPEQDTEKYEAPVSYYLKNRADSAARLNRFRTALDFSFESKLKEKFNVLHTIWGTNMHGAATVGGGSVEYTAFRIADFAVCSKEWQSCEIGVFHKSQCGLIRVDDKAVTTTVHWRELSDHFPIGGRFSLGADDRNVQLVFVEERDADFVAARNVMYLHDILDAFYLDAEKNKWKEIASFWPKQPPSERSGDSSKAKASEMEEEPTGAAYADAFEIRKKLLLERLKSYPDLWEFSEAISKLTVTSP